MEDRGAGADTHLALLGVKIAGTGILGLPRKSATGRFSGCMVTKDVTKEFLRKLLQKINRKIHKIMSEREPEEACSLMANGELLSDEITR